MKKFVFLILLFVVSCGKQSKENPSELQIKEIAQDASFLDYCEANPKSKESNAFFKALKQYFRLGINSTCNELEDRLEMTKKLDLSLHQLEEVHLLKFAKNLETLILRDNNIRSFEWINSLENLRHIDLSFNEVMLLPKFENLKNLKHLNLSNNNLKNGENLLQLLKDNQLEFFSIVSNNIKNFNLLVELEKYAPKRFEDAFFIEDDVCEKWRRIALKYGKISKRKYEVLQILNEIPILPNWKNPAYGEVRESGDCSIHIDKLLRLF